MSPRWKSFWIAAIILIIILAGLTALGFWRRAEMKKTEDAIARMNERRITLDDVMGKNLPPKPDQELNDSTVAGIDANNNGIRDDVELAIFAKYPHSARIRAAMLQYAKALQAELTQVFNSASLISAIQKEALAYGCLGDVGLNKESKQKEIENLTINNNIRKNRIDEVFEYLTGHGYKNEPNCEVNLSILPN
jgi:hypothetical protein